MSESTLYEVFRTKVYMIDEYKNGRGSGPILWDYLAETYLGGRIGFGEGYDPLWALGRDRRVPMEERLCLVMTFDNAVIEPDRIRELALACCAVAPRLNPLYENHWGAFGATLGDYKVRDHRMLGIALNCTSVEDQWRYGQPQKKKLFGVGAYANSTATA
ncbi:MAG: hypothetical protein EOP83_15330 [Verrucomicrobiaceae bacterium]|nr:MAG: hypothetical protein EOP83_15330 [Verrucomicrobiaceae bacterium]